jgi:hypothetical protein
MSLAALLFEPVRLRGARFRQYGIVTGDSLRFGPDFCDIVSHNRRTDKFL